MLPSTTMPILHAAEKRMRADRKRRLRNQRVESELKSLTRKFEKLCAEKSDQAQGALRSLIKRLDQAASKGILHRNAASRTKSRLSRRLVKLS